MKYSVLIKWFNSKKWFEKFFLFLILIRPIVEPFFYLKTSSPLLSPLYWLGLLTFFITLTGIFFSRKVNSKFDNPFKLWTVLVIINILMLSFSTEIMTFVFFALKLLYPVLIFFLLRTIIKGRFDLYGILTFFLYSSIIAMVWFIYDVSHFGLNLRDGSSFADIVNYGFYANFGLIILLYFNLKKKEWFIMRINSFALFVGLMVAVLCILAIRHMASIVVIFTIVAVYVYIISKRNIKIGLGLVLLCTLFLIAFGGAIYDEIIAPRIDKEIEVAQGSREESQALHGRMSRWQDRGNDFMNAGTVPQFFGYPLSMEFAADMIGVAPHNDFLRILFFTGIFGIVIYLIFITKCFLRIRSLLSSEKYLALATMLTYILYSISTVPTFYPGFNNFSFTVIAFISLPKKILRIA